MGISEIINNQSMTTLSTVNRAKSTKMSIARPNEISDTYSASSESQEFKNIVGKFNVTNMSRNEAGQMFHELYENGYMSILELGIATFDPSGIPGWQDGVSNIDGWKVRSDPDAKMNYLEGFKTQAEYNEKYGSPQFQDNYDQMVRLAEKIYFFQT